MVKFAIYYNATFVGELQLKMSDDDDDDDKKKFRYRRETARRAMSVEILSTAAQLYEKSHLKSLQ